MNFKNNITKVNLSPREKISIPFLIPNKTKAYEYDFSPQEESFDCYLNTQILCNKENEKQDSEQIMNHINLSCIGFTQMGSFIDAIIPDNDNTDDLDVFNSCVRLQSNYRKLKEKEILQKKEKINKSTQNTKIEKYQSNNVKFKLGSLDPFISILVVVLLPKHEKENILQKSPNYNNNNNNNYHNLLNLKTQVQVPSNATELGNQLNGEWIIHAENSKINDQKPLILGYFYRNETEHDSSWIFHTSMSSISLPNVWIDMIPEIRQNMAELNIIDENIVNQCQWNPNSDIAPFKLTTDSVFELPPDYPRIHVEMGWEAPFSMESSLIPFDEDGIPILKDIVSDGNIFTQGISYQSNNQFDDHRENIEKLNLNVDEIPSDFCTLLIVLNISDQNHNFNQVNHVFIRFGDRNSNQEICRYTINNMEPNNALVLCKLERSNHKSSFDQEFFSDSILWKGRSKWIVKCLGDVAPGNKSGTTAKFISPFPYKRMLSIIYVLEFKFRVYIHQGNRLISKDRNGLSDPFVKIICDQNSTTSSIRHKTLNPNWNEEVSLTVDMKFRHEEREIYLDHIRNQLSFIDFRVYDYDRITTNDAMGGYRYQFNENQIEKMVDLKSRGKLEFFDEPQEVKLLLPEDNEKFAGTLKIRVSTEKILKTRFKSLGIKSNSY